MKKGHKSDIGKQSSQKKLHQRRTKP